MARIVGVHGIAQQLKGPEVLAAEWGPALRDGVQANGGLLGPDALACAFYGGLFRAPGVTRAVDEQFAITDLDDEDVELICAMWKEAARREPQRVVPPDAATRGTPEVAQAAVRALTTSKFLVGVAERAFIGSLKQVRRYFADPNLRAAAIDAVDRVVTVETRVLVGHSLGSVVAYEALHRYGGTEKWQRVKTFVTLGSPLGIENLIFDRLNPLPVAGHGAWPRVIEAWTNIADDGDLVALVKKLGPKFDERIVDLGVSNEARAHDILPYLTAADTGRVIAAGLR